MPRKGSSITYSSDMKIETNQDWASLDIDRYVQELETRGFTRTKNED